MDLVEGSLDTHHNSQNGVRQGGFERDPPPPAEPRVYRISIPREAFDIAYPVEGCPWRANIRIALQNYFLHRHMQDMLVVLEEGGHPLLLCPKIDNFYPCMALNGRHQYMAMYSRGGG